MWLLLASLTLTNAVPFSIKFGGQAWGMAKSVDQGATWTPIATVDMHTYQQVGMVGEVRGDAQEGMMIKFEPLHTSLARALGYQCPKMHEKCDGTCTFDASRNFQCFNWDNAKIFIYELNIDGQKQDFSSLNTMQSSGWNFQCRFVDLDSSCQPAVSVIDFDDGQKMLRQDGADFYYTYTFTGIGTPRLLSEGKPTSSSTLFHGGSSISWPSSNAVQDIDNLGNHCSWGNRGSVAIAAGTGLFWQVDLEDVFAIKTIKILGFNHEGYSDNVQFNVCNDAAGSDCAACGGLVSATPGSWVQTSCSLSGRFIRLINQDSNKKNWHFCRIAVYGIGTESSQVRQNDDVHIVLPTRSDLESIGFTFDGLDLSYSNDPVSVVKRECGNTAFYAWGHRGTRSMYLQLQGAGSVMMKIQGCFDNQSGAYDVDVYTGESLISSIPERNCNAPTTDTCATTVEFDFTEDTTLRIHQNGWSVIQIWEVKITYKSEAIADPTAFPTVNPTLSPSYNPTAFPTVNPTLSPSYNPTAFPTVNPTLSPSYNPSSSPSKRPSVNPTVSPTANPSRYPTAEGFIIKVKGFHGQPKSVLDANKLESEGQGDVDIEMYGFDRKLVPVGRRLLKQKD